MYKRQGYDTVGEVVVQAPAHVIENHRRLLKAGDDPVKVKRVQKVKPAAGQIVWSESTFDRPVSYTHLDVYKRQGMRFNVLAFAIFPDGTQSQVWDHQDTVCVYPTQTVRQSQAVVATSLVRRRS